MAKGDISIGDNTPTGEPENGPRGPYIHDDDDGSRIERMIAEEHEAALKRGSHGPPPPPGPGELPAKRRNSGPDSVAHEEAFAPSEPDIPDDPAARPKGPAQP